MKDHFDFASGIVIVITFVLFVLALFTKGLTHDIFLEAGVFLVSVKIILLAYNNGRDLKRLGEEIREIKELLRQQERKGPEARSNGHRSQGEGMRSHQPEEKPL